MRNQFQRRSKVTPYPAPPQKLARCGGRLALAREWRQRRANAWRGHGERGEFEDVLALWNEARATDGGGPAPQAHRLVLDALADEERNGGADRLRERYVERVAGNDLDAEAAATIAGWIRERLQARRLLDAWMRTLHAACGERWDTGTRSATLRVHPRPGERWHTEHGVHRITHLSGTGSGRGRRHTSFVAVEALEEPAPAETPTIAREVVRIDVFRGSGPGGQYRNATESAVRIRHIESGITAVCAGARSQHANYEAAMRVLGARLAERDRRAAESARARARRNRAPAGFGHHIRTYGMERDSVHDTARGVRVSGANAVLEGDLGRLWSARRSKSR